MKTSLSGLNVTAVVVVGVNMISSYLKLQHYSNKAMYTVCQYGEKDTRSFFTGRERERERERETERETDRQTERERERERNDGLVIK